MSEAHVPFLAPKGLRSGALARTSAEVMGSIALFRGIPLFVGDWVAMGIATVYCFRRRTT